RRTAASRTPPSGVLFGQFRFHVAHLTIGRLELLTRVGGPPPGLRFGSLGLPEFGDRRVPALPRPAESHPAPRPRLSLPLSLRFFAALFFSALFLSVLVRSFLFLSLLFLSLLFLLLLFLLLLFLAETLLLPALFVRLSLLLLPLRVAALFR